TATAQVSVDVNQVGQQAAYQLSRACVGKEFKALDHDDREIRVKLDSFWFRSAEALQSGAIRVTVDVSADGGTHNQCLTVDLLRSDGRFAPGDERFVRVSFLPTRGNFALWSKDAWQVQQAVDEVYVPQKSVAHAVGQAATDWLTMGFANKQLQGQQIDG